MCDNTEMLQLFELLLVLEADAHFRSLLLKDKCNELNHMKQYVERVQRAHTRAQEAAEERQRALQEESERLKHSINDAVQRARQIRKSSLNKINDKDDKSSRRAKNENVDIVSKKSEPTSVPLSTPRGLQDILEIARTSRGLSDPDSSDQTGELESPVLRPQTPLRLEYPGRMKGLMEQLQDTLEKEQFFREHFCRKMTEKLSINGNATSASSSIVPPIPTRIQVSIPNQIDRLQRCYEQMATYLSTRVSPESETFQNALKQPTLASIFPVYCRIKQAKKLLKRMNEETKALGQRVPPKPILSQAAIDYRDAVIARLHKPTDNSKPGPELLSIQQSNHTLHAKISKTTGLSPNSAVTEKLQAAWEQDERTAASDNIPIVDAYESVIHELILQASSDVVLSTFQSVFCQGDEDGPSEAQLKMMMKLIRLVDSLALQDGRKQRSVVAVAR